MDLKNFSKIKDGMIAALIFFVFLEAVSAGDATQKEIAKEIDSYFSEKFAANGPGAVVLAAKEGEVILRKAYGMANLELEVPLKPEMVFRIGSITKQFTSAAVMMLVEEGNISLDDEITKFIPDYPVRGNKITIHHLLNHTSGIKSYDEIEDFHGNIRKDYKPNEFVETFKAEPMEFKPGEQFKYNNSDYFLLGMVIEKASGKSYEEFVHERIFKPLGMTNSYYGSHRRIIPNRAAGYQIEENGYANADFISMTQMYAGGALLSTADDLWTWTEALHEGKVISRKSLMLLTMPTQYADGRTENYGYGLWLKPLFGEKMAEHNGGINGYLTHVLYLPEENIFVTVLTNALVVADAPFLARWTAALLCGKDVHRKKAILPDTTILDEVAGVYKIEKDEFLTITREGIKLYSQTTGGRKAEIFASSEDDFFYEDSFSHFIVVRDRHGKVIKLVMHSQGPDEEAVKTDKIPPVRKRIELNVNIFKDLTGVYESDDGMEIAVRQKAGKFYAQLKGQPEFEIFPESENIFFFKVADAQLEFMRDAERKVTGLQIHQGGRTLRMKRK